MTTHEKTPTVAAVEALKTHLIGDGTQDHYNLILFPLHRRRSLFTLSERCHAWRSIRCPRGDYKTPFKEDLRHG